MSKIERVFCVVDGVLYEVLEDWKGQANCDANSDGLCPGCGSLGNPVGEFCYAGKGALGVHGWAMKEVISNG